MLESRAHRGFVVALTVLCAGMSALALMTSLPQLDRPFPGFKLLQNVRVQQILPAHWSGYQAGLRPMDRVVAVNGRHVDSVLDVYAVVNAVPVGTPVRYTFERPTRGAATETLERAIRTQRFTFDDWLPFVGALWVVGLVNLTLACLTAFWRPDDAAARAHVLFFLGCGVFFTLAPTSTTVPPLLSAWTFALIMGAMGWSGVNLAVIYPSRLPPRWESLARRAVYAAGALLVALCLGAAFEFWPATYAHWTGMGLVVAACLAMTVNLLVSLSRRLDERERTRAGWLMMGFLLTYLPGMVVAGGGYFGYAVPGSKYAYLLSVAFPLSAAIAIVRHNLFDINLLLRPTLNYGLLAAGLGGLYALAAVLVNGAIGAKSPVAQALVVATVVFASGPLRDRLKGWLDAAFFRRVDDPMAVARFAEKARDLRDVESLVLAFQEAVASSMGVTASGVYLADGSVFQDGEAPAGAPAHESGGRAIVVPLMSDGEARGVVWIGPKRSGLPHRSPDRELAAALAAQLALWLAWLERLQRDQARQHELEVIRRGQELQDQFLGMVSHELKTPVAAILGAIELVDRSGPAAEPERLHRYHARIRRGAESLSLLLDDVLYAHQLQSGGFRLAHASVNVAEVVDDVAHELGSLIEARSQALEVDVAPGVPAVWGDRHRLAQALRNLIHNAIKHSPEGGLIRVRVTGTEEVSVAVDDAGPGIPPEDVPKLFSRFERLGGEQPGVGLGLYIVKALVEAHGGAVSVGASDLGGASFRMTLPSAKASHLQD